MGVSALLVLLILVRGLLSIVSLLQFRLLLLNIFLLQQRGYRSRYRCLLIRDGLQIFFLFSFLFNYFDCLFFVWGSIEFFGWFRFSSLYFTRLFFSNSGSNFYGSLALGFFVLISFGFCTHNGLVIQDFINKLLLVYFFIIWNVELLCNILQLWNNHVVQL